LLTLRNEIIHPRDNPSGPDVFVGLEHIESGTGRRVGSEPIEKSQMTGRKARFRVGDIVYGYLRPYLNKVWVADFDGLCSVDQYVYRVDEGRADRDYIAWFMRSPVFLSRAPVDSGPGQLPRIRLNEVADVEVDLPSFPEQQQASASLQGQIDAAARMRAAADSIAERIECLSAAALERSFSCASGTGYAAMKLEDVALVTGGIQKSPARAPRSFHRPFLTVRNVQRGHLDLSDVEHMEVTPAELERLELRSGDLLIVEGNGSRDQIGRNALFGAEIAECVHQNHLIRVRVNAARLRPEFLSLYLNSRDGMSQMAQKAVSTTGLYTLSVRKIQSLEIPVPNPSTQDAMIHAWECHRKARERGRTAATSQAAAAEMLPAALLRQAFVEGRGEGDD
jgi:type I restriction enzyme S subunit